MATKPKANTSNDVFTSEQVEGAMAGTRPSDFARALGLDGKYVRGVLRSQGVFVSRGGTFDADAKQALLGALTERARKRSGSTSE